MNKLRQKRLERLHEDYLEASKRWPELYHAAITVVPDDRGARTLEEAKAILRLYSWEGTYDNLTEDRLRQRGRFSGGRDRARESRVA